MCARVAQLVRANVGRCSPNTRHMVPGLNFFFLISNHNSLRRG